MKNKIKTWAVTLFAAGTMMISGALPASASYTYEKLEANGIEQKVEKEYGKAVKIRVIEISGKGSLGIVEDRAKEITFEDGTIVTYHHDHGKTKTVERIDNGKKVTERFEKPWGGKPYKDEWEIHKRIVEYEKGGARIKEEFWLNSMNTDIELKYVIVEKPTNDWKIVEEYQRNDYFDGKKPWGVSIITEKVIYPKGTDRNKSEEYYNNQNQGLEGKKFFEEKSYLSIERKLVEEKNEAGEMTRRRFETVLKDVNGVTEKRIEQDFEFKHPICDGKIDFRQSIQQTHDGTYEKIDYDGDGVADEEITNKITTIYLN